MDLRWVLPFEQLFDEVSVCVGLVFLEGLVCGRGVMLHGGISSLILTERHALHTSLKLVVLSVDFIVLCTTLL